MEQSVRVRVPLPAFIIIELGETFMINWIRRQFCKHGFVHVQKNRYAWRIIDTYMCKKCGLIRKIET